MPTILRHDEFRTSLVKLVATDEFIALDFGAMTDKQLIELCIQKFRELRAYAEQHGPDIGWQGVKTCALCKKYYAPSTNGSHYYCEGCPISKKTGQWVCKDTPYIKLSESEQGQLSLEEFLTLVDEEIAFLESLPEYTEAAQA